MSTSFKQRSHSARGSIPQASRSDEPKLPRTPLLSPSEERRLVDRLGQLRQKIHRLIEPAVKAASNREDTADEPRHFDQWLAAYTAIEPANRSRHPQLTKLLAEYNAIKQELVVRNLAWVTKMARAQRLGNLSDEDLFQEGVCGLLKAIDRFEPERGLRLMTYATWYIREAMQQLRARHAHLVGLSAHDQTLLGRVEMVSAAFLHQHQRLPTLKELSESLGGNHRALRQLQVVGSPSISLDRGFTDGAMPIPIDDWTNEVDRADELRGTVSTLLAALPERERLIVARRFGLDGNEPASLEVLGQDLHVSKERVRQLQRQALRRMMRKAEEENLAPATG